MRRADRLFEIIQVLRRASRPLTADQIASELETSRWTIYRDIAALIAQRVPIRGEAGVGYVLERGFDLPPLMLTSEEVEAVQLGVQWVISHGDVALARAARDVLAKLSAIVPEGLRAAMRDPVVGAPTPRLAPRDGGLDLARLRRWTRAERKLALRYRDGNGCVSERTIWPFLIGYEGTTRALLAWCELRADFRVFFADRVLTLTFLDETYPEARAALRRRWLARVEAAKAAGAR